MQLWLERMSDTSCDMDVKYVTLELPQKILGSMAMTLCIPVYPISAVQHSERDGRKKSLGQMRKVLTWAKQRKVECILSR